MQVDLVSEVSDRVAKKARKIVESGGVIVLRSGIDEFVIRGEHNLYRVKLGRTGGSCECPARKLCAHLVAAMAYAGWMPPPLRPI